jgi:hypothetical protein
LIAAAVPSISGPSTLSSRCWDWVSIGLVFDAIA